MARIVTVHLLVADPEFTNVADGVGEMLRAAEMDGYLVDWCFAENTDSVGKILDVSEDYEVGEFIQHAPKLRME
jgi:hypothetical protein